MNLNPANWQANVLCEVRCCYCNLLMGRKRCSVPAGVAPVTHGICQPCYRKHIRPWEVKCQPTT